MFKSIRLTVLSLIALAVVSPRILAQVQPSDGVTSLNENPLQIAILHWCKTNRVTQFKVGDAPIRVAFDGGNLWVVNNGSNNVTKLRTSDGTNLGTFPVGAGPQGVAFDGAHIWVLNNGSNNVTKLGASDGGNLGRFSVGIGPTGAYSGRSRSAFRGNVDHDSGLKPISARVWPEG